jgi:hypothetical protein
MGDTLDRLHGAIEHEIGVAYERVEHAAPRAEEDWGVEVMDDEWAAVEGLLGLAFVAGQTFMTGVRTSIAGLGKELQDVGHPLSLGHPPVLVSADGRGARGLFDIGNPLQSGSPHTGVRVINEVANFWKHQDEWPITYESAAHPRRCPDWDWEAMAKNERCTLEIVGPIGMAPCRSGNLRDAAGALGVGDFRDLSPIRQKLKDWANDLYQEARAEVDGLRSGRDM